MKPVEIHYLAAAEVEAAASYYEGKRSGLGRKLVLEFETTLASIVLNPTLVATTFGDARFRRMRRFPYLIYYVDFDDHIWFAAVAHQRRRPGYWQDRSPGDR